MKLIPEVQKIVDFHVEQYGLDAKLTETMAQVITKRVAEKRVEIANRERETYLANTPDDASFSRFSDLQGAGGCQFVADAIRTHFDLGGGGRVDEQ